MPETRTYDPSAGDPVGDAIRAALGETVRPREPGAQAPGEAKPAPRRPTITTIGSYTFTRVPPPAPAAEPDADDADATEDV